MECMARLFATCGAEMREWYARAACRRADPELFFPLGRNADRLYEARRYCAVCPVRAECLRLALDTQDDEPVGISGGLTEQERARVASGTADPDALWAATLDRIREGTP